MEGDILEKKYIKKSYHLLMIIDSRSPKKFRQCDKNGQSQAECADQFRKSTCHHYSTTAAAITTFICFSTSRYSDTTNVNAQAIDAYDQH